MGVIISFALSITNILSISLQYFDWLINMSSPVCLIWSQRKKFKSPILNSFCMIFEKSLHKDSLVAPKTISYTYICTKSISCSFRLMKRGWIWILYWRHQNDEKQKKGWEFWNSHDFYWDFELEMGRRNTVSMNMLAEYKSMA